MFCKVLNAMRTISAKGSWRLKSFIIKVADGVLQAQRHQRREQFCCSRNSQNLCLLSAQHKFYCINSCIFIGNFKKSFKRQMLLQMKRSKPVTRKVKFPSCHSTVR